MNSGDDGDRGLAVEDENPQERISHPFDPEQTKIRTVHVLLDQLIDRVRYGEIDLASEFQRQSDIWDPTRRSRLVESLLLRIPIPVFYVASDTDGLPGWRVVHQRRLTVSLPDASMSATDFIGSCKRTLSLNARFPLPQVQSRACTSVLP